MRGLLIPSLHERERFCRCEAYGGCPTLRAFRARGAPLPQADYYALWLGHDEEEPARATAALGEGEAVQRAH